jgi:hypothetical protein
VRELACRRQTSWVNRAAYSGVTRISRFTQRMGQLIDAMLCRCRARDARAYIRQRAGGSGSGLAQTVVDEPRGPSRSGCGMVEVEHPMVCDAARRRLVGSQASMVDNAWWKLYITPAMGARIRSGARSARTRGEVARHLSPDRRRALIWPTPKKDKLSFVASGRILPAEILRRGGRAWPLSHCITRYGGRSAESADAGQHLLLPR